MIGIDASLLTRALNLKPSRAMRSIQARGNYRRARLRHLDTHEGTSKSLRDRAVDEGSMEGQRLSPDSRKTALREPAP